MKWLIDKNISFKRCENDSLMFKTNNTKYWLKFITQMTNQCFKSHCRDFAKFMDAETIEIKETEWDAKTKDYSVKLIMISKLDENNYKFYLEKPILDENGKLKDYEQIYFSKEDILLYN